MTIAAYQRFAVRHALKPPSGEGTLPFTGLTWAQAKQYCSAIGGRLPSEAEWEFAARAGSSQAYYGMVPKIAWYAENSGDSPHAVGSKQPNAWGLYDMLGNVWQWCEDLYEKGSSNRVFRGGAWSSRYDHACRAGYRVNGIPSRPENDVGFRLVRVPSDRK